MKSFIVFAVLFGCAFASNLVLPATTLLRSPSDDSAIIQSERYGGNFAYSTVEGHAYKAVSPVIQNIVKPVSISYEARLAPWAYSHGIPYTTSAWPLNAASWPYAYGRAGIFY